MNITDKRVLVTGGSSGIGFEIAAELLRRGARVVANGRRQDTLESAVERLSAFGETHGIAADVTTPGGQQLLVDGAIDRLGGLDILVNNAGGVSAGPLDTVDEDDISRMIDVNLTAPILLTRAALSPLRDSGDAVIVNVSSGIAQVGLPFYATYAATKAGIAHFGEALRRELAGSGVAVLTVFPTATETPMMATSAMGRFNGRERPEDVALAVVDAMAHGRREVVRGDEGRLRLVALNESVPEMVDAELYQTRELTGEAVRKHRAL